MKKEWKEPNMKNLMVEKTNEEINILEHYMPEMLSEQEITKEVENAIKESNASSIKDMGNVMKILSSKLKGKADMSLVSSIIKDKLK